MKPSSRKAEIVETLAVSVVAAFYLFHWWPVPVSGIIAALACVTVSSLPLWFKGFREARRYGPVLQSFGFGLLLAASVLRGKSSTVFAIGFGILIISSLFRAFREFSRNSL